MVGAVALFEPLLAAGFERADRVLPAWARWFVWRPALYALGSVLFLIFDDRDTQFISSFREVFDADS